MTAKSSSYTTSLRAYQAPSKTNPPPAPKHQEHRHARRPQRRSPRSSSSKKGRTTIGRLSTLTLPDMPLLQRPLRDELNILHRRASMPDLGDCRKLAEVCVVKTESSEGTEPPTMTVITGSRKQRPKKKHERLVKRGELLASVDFSQHVFV